MEFVKKYDEQINLQQKSENKIFGLLIIITILTKVIHYLYPFADEYRWCFYLMNTICRCGLVWLFLVCGVFAAWYNKNLLSLGMRCIGCYLLWGIIYFIYRIIGWYFTGQLTLRKGMSWFYGFLLGEPGFIWCLYGIGLSFLLIHICKKSRILILGGDFTAGIYVL